MFSSPLQIAILVIVTILLFVLLFKKLFKLLLIVALAFAGYLAYVYFTGGDVKKTIKNTGEKARDLINK